jgi:hypothetical protein
MAGRRRRKASTLPTPVPPRELTEFPIDPDTAVTDYDTVLVWLDWLRRRDEWATVHGYDPDGDWIIG